MIEISGITKKFGKQKAVDGLTLKIGAKSVFGFLGPNGAGKTTTMKMIVGLAKPDVGTIKIGGRPSSDPEAREDIGFMPENPYFYDYLTGFEFLRFCGRLFKKSYDKTKEEYLDILKKVNLYEARDKLVRTYSKGMKQRLGFAQAIINDQEYIFLDEPLDGLDPLGRREIKNIIKTLQTEGRTVFFNSHILSDVEDLCDEIGIIYAGKLIYSGPVRDFTKGRTLEEQFISTIQSLEDKQPESPEHQS